MFVDCCEIQEVFGRVKIQTILKPFLLFSSFCQEAYPNLSWTERSNLKLWLKHFCQISQISLIRLLLDELSRHDAEIWSEKNDTSKQLAFATSFPVLLSPSTCNNNFLTFRLRICCFHPRCESKKQFCHEMKIRSWFPHRNVLDDTRPSHRGLDRSSCFHGSTLAWNDSSLRGKVYSRHDVFTSSSPTTSSVMKNRPVNVLQKTSIGAEFGQFLLFKKFCAFLLVFTEQVSSYFGISLANRVISRKFCRYNHWFQILIRGGFPRTSWVSGLFSTQIRQCSVDTELIDGNNCAKNQFNDVITTIEVNGFHSFPFAFEVSSL